ncbi:hypothetical protein GQ54DRAFT_303033 [Martensiomyces pterosporus]|nr:hypothetical protein GQ54DRAFT_303033 [Martensiomyces pterosporus]
MKTTASALVLLSILVATASAYPAPDYPTTDWNDENRDWPVAVLNYVSPRSNGPAADTQVPEHQINGPHGPSRDWPVIVIDTLPPIRPGSVRVHTIRGAPPTEGNQ